MLKQIFKQNISSYNLIQNSRQKYIKNQILSNLQYQNKFYFSNKQNYQKSTQNFENDSQTQKIYNPRSYKNKIHAKPVEINENLNKNTKQEEQQYESEELKDLQTGGFNPILAFFLICGNLFILSKVYEFMEKRSQQKQNNSPNNGEQENLDDGISMHDKMKENILKKEIQNKEDVQIIKIDSSSQKEDLDKIQSLLNQKEAGGGQQQQKKSIFFGSSKEQQQNQKQGENLEQESKKQILVMDPTQVKLSVEKQIQKIKEFTSQNEDYNMQLQLLKQINKQAENGYLVYKEIARTQYILLQKINKKMKEIINQNQEYLDEQKKELKSSEFKDLYEKINKQHKEMEQNYNKLNENTFQQIELYQKQNQSDPEIFYLKAALYKLNNKIQEGVANLDQLIQLVPYDTKPIIAKGLFYREAQMYQESQKVFEQAIEQFPNRPDGYINMAYLLKQQGQQQKCMEYFEKAVNIQPAYENQRSKFQEQQEQQPQKNEKS